MVLENKIRLVFLWLTFSVVFFSRFLDNFKEYLPGFLTRPLKYGRFANDKETYVWSSLEVPKSWYRIFYIYSSLINLYSFVVVFKVYMFGSQPPIWLMNLLDAVGGYDRYTTVSSTHTLLAIAMVTTQILRRAYESWFVSVFGDKSKLNIYHIILALTHYSGVMLAILVEAPIFTRSVLRTDLSFGDLTLVDHTALILFCWAWYHQKNTTAILGNLRKSANGEVVTQKYIMPRGDWFEYLSSPHYIAEILIYFSISVILSKNWTWMCLFIWVVANQVQFSLVSDWWYRANFKDFPKERKVLIPFVY